jgi:hypothetical protein
MWLHRSVCKANGSYPCHLPGVESADQSALRSDPLLASTPPHYGPKVRARGESPHSNCAPSMFTRTSRQRLGSRLLAPFTSSLETPQVRHLDRRTVRKVTRSGTKVTQARNRVQVTSPYRPGSRPIFLLPHKGRIEGPTRSMMAEPKGLPPTGLPHVEAHPLGEWLQPRPGS